MAKTIVIEDRLKEVFDYLPLMIGPNDLEYKPVFKAGDRKELLAFFKKSSGNTNYPLIWLELPYEEEHKNKKRVSVSQLNLILAVETNASMLYAERIDTTFKKILYPLLDNILDVLRVGNITDYDNSYKIVKFGNYADTTDGNEAKFIDIWDAIKLTIDLSINDNCLRPIKI